MSVDELCPVLCVSNCEETKFSYFWNGPVDDLDEKFAGIPEKPTVEDVKKRLKEKGIKDPIVVIVPLRKSTSAFAWIDLANIDNVLRDKESEVDEDGFSTVSAVSHRGSALDMNRRILTAALYAVSHAYSSFKPLYAELEKRGIIVEDGVKKEIEEAQEKYRDKVQDDVEDVALAESLEALNKKKIEVIKEVKTVHNFVKKIIPEIITGPDPHPHPEPDLIKELKAQIDELTKERDGLKRRVEELEEEIKKPAKPDSKPDPKIEKLQAEVEKLTKERDGLKESLKELPALKDELQKLQSKIGKKREPVLPDVVNKTFVFKHPDNVKDDDHVYLMRDTDAFPFAFFYIEKEFIDQYQADEKNKKLDLTKDIHCLITSIEKHCSSQSEKELTAKYHVRLGEDFYLCKGKLSQ